MDACIIINTEFNSDSISDPARFVTLLELERGFAKLSPQPRDEGKVVLVVRRQEGGRRELLVEANLSPELGAPGDSWARKEDRNFEAQIAAMQVDAARVIANGQSVALFSSVVVRVGDRVRVLTRNPEGIIMIIIFLQQL